MEKYGGTPLYDIDIENRYTIDDEEIHFVKKYVYVLIGNPENTYVTSTDHEYFLIHDDLFDRVLETDHNSYDVVQRKTQDVPFSTRHLI